MQIELEKSNESKSASNTTRLTSDHYQERISTSKRLTFPDSSHGEQLGSPNVNVECLPS